MSRTSALRSILSTALVSPVAFAGFSPPPVPADAVFPYITCQEVGGKSHDNIIGASGLVRVVMQLNCWDPDHDTAWALRQRVKDFLTPAGAAGYSGSSDGLVIAGTNHAGDREFYDGQRELHQLICTFMMWWDDG